MHLIRVIPTQYKTSKMSSRTSNLVSITTRTDRWVERHQGQDPLSKELQAATINEWTQKGLTSALLEQRKRETSARDSVACIG